MRWEYKVYYRDKNAQVPTSSDRSAGARFGSFPTAPVRSYSRRWNYRTVSSGFECPANSCNVRKSIPEVPWKVRYECRNE